MIATTIFAIVGVITTAVLACLGLNHVILTYQKGDQ